MPFKPNYRLQRTIRSTAKKAKAEEKLKDQLARVAARKDDADIVRDDDPEETK